MFHGLSSLIKQCYLTLYNLVFIIFQTSGIPCSNAYTGLEASNCQGHRLLNDNPFLEPGGPCDLNLVGFSSRSLVNKTQSPLLLGFFAYILRTVSWPSPNTQKKPLLVLVTGTEFSNKTFTLPFSPLEQ